MPSTKKYLLILQVVVWFLSFVFFYFYLRQRLQAYPTSYILSVSLSSFISFGIIIYGYIFLYNDYISRKKLVNFLLSAVILFVSVFMVRVAVEDVYIAPLSGTRSSIFDQGRVHLTYTLVSCFFALIVGILSKSFLEVILLRTKQAEIEKKHLEAELMQLKAHVQPHFLFNSLNNIYYDTYKVLPDVAERIDKLSNIMRYFIEENPKEHVLMSSEINFIESYIELEKIRFHSSISVDIEKNIAPNTKVPPMLLIPLVENVFKHGVQNNNHVNKIEIALSDAKGKIYFMIKNTIHQPVGTKRIGTGLKNLRERLNLLYKDDYALYIRNSDGYFIAELMIPKP